MILSQTLDRAMDTTNFFFIKSSVSLVVMKTGPSVDHNTNL